MTDWIATLIPVGSLLLGSALTILGQHLADRRTLKRDRENRREEFRKIAFEHERPALLELQEILAEFSQKLHSEKRRRDAEKYYECVDEALAEKSLKEIDADIKGWTDDVEAAAQRIAPYIKDATSLLNSPQFSKDNPEHRAQLDDLLAKIKANASSIKSHPELMSSIVSKGEEQTARLLEMKSQFEQSSDSHEHSLTS